LRNRSHESILKIFHFIKYEKTNQIFIQFTRTRKQLAPLLKQAADSFSGISCPIVVVGAENGIRPLTGNLYRAKAARNARSLTRHGSSNRIFTYKKFQK
jgi:hypothetical protein